MNLLQRLAAQAPDWTASALCAQADPDLWFGHGGEAAIAKRICLGCPVRDRCRDEALDDESLTGIWGATTRRERGRLRNQPQRQKEPV